MGHFAVFACLVIFKIMYCTLVVVHCTGSGLLLSSFEKCYCFFYYAAHLLIDYLAPCRLVFMLCQRTLVGKLNMFPKPPQLLWVSTSKFSFHCRSFKGLVLDFVRVVIGWTLPERPCLLALFGIQYVYSVLVSMVTVLYSYYKPQVLLPWACASQL